MYSAILNGLSKIQKEAEFLRKFWLYSMMGGRTGVLLPAECAKAVATFSIIIAISLLDEALSLYINANYNPTSREVASLEKKIEYVMASVGGIDAGALHKIRKMRNSYAHEANQYGTWDELDNVISVVRAELGKLGIS